MFLLTVLSACSGGGGGSGDGGSGGSGGGGGGGGGTVIPGLPAVEETGPDYRDLSGRGVGETVTLSLIGVANDGSSVSDSATFSYLDGAITGANVLGGTDLDDTLYLNIPSGEFSRMFSLDGSSDLLGAIGLVTAAVDRPDAGTTQYNQGWVGLTATDNSTIYTLTGTATFTASWENAAVLNGTFDNLSGIRDAQVVSNVGTITLNNASISGSTFSGGTVAGTGDFSALDAGSSTAGTEGVFFGPQADELGGVLIINDTGSNLFVQGAFQAD